MNGSNEETAAKFWRYLLDFRNDPKVVDLIGSRVQLNKRAVINALVSIESRYQDASELRALLGLLC